MKTALVFIKAQIFLIRTEFPYGGYKMPEKIHWLTIGSQLEATTTNHRLVVVAPVTSV